MDKLPEGTLPSEVVHFVESLAKQTSVPPPFLCISARNPDDVRHVQKAIRDFFDRDLVEAELFVPYDRQQLRGVIFSAADVKEERFDEAGTFFKVRTDAVSLKKLAQDVQEAVGTHVKE